MSTRSSQSSKALPSAAGVLLSFLMFATLGCSSSSAESPEKSAAQAVSASTAFAFSEADLEAYEKGLAQETALVRVAKVRGDNAKTPEERGKAAQDEWEDQTIPGGAQAAGLPVERYRNVRKTVNRVLETLDFQGKINGPLEIDLANATSEMKQRLNSDPFSELSPVSAAALRARMSKLLPVWVQYMQLTAVNG
jgi:hypothetical protein